MVIRYLINYFANLNLVNSTISEQHKITGCNPFSGNQFIYINTRFAQVAFIINGIPLEGKQSQYGIGLRINQRVILFIK